MFRSLLRSSWKGDRCERKRYTFDLLTRQSSNTGKLLALEQLQAGTSTSGDVAQLVLDAILGGDGSCVTTTDDDNLALVLDTIDNSIQGRLGTVGELLKLKDTSGAVPKDGLGLADSLLVQLHGLLTTVETHPAIGNAFSVGGCASVGVLGELVRGDIVHRQDNLDALLLGLLHKRADRLGSSLVEEGVANGDTLESLLEGESHATANDEGIDLVQQVVDELDLVRDLGTSEDGEEGTLRSFESLGKVVELLLHEETGSLLWEVDTDHGGVSTVGSTESIIFQLLATVMLDEGHWPTY